MTRSTPRELYDFFYMINTNIFNETEINKIKRCAVFYRAISNEDAMFDFNLDNLDSITQNNIKRFLIPVINAKVFSRCQKLNKPLMISLTNTLY